MLQAIAVRKKAMDGLWDINGQNAEGRGQRAEGKK
jgi:hypothetical protein